MTKGAFQKDYPSVKGPQMTVMTVTISVHLSLFSLRLCITCLDLRVGLGGYSRSAK